MTVRSVVNQGFQYGVEATRGAGGSANRKFGEVIVKPNFAGDVFTHMGQGVKGITSVTQGNQLMDLPFTATWNFNDLAVLFAVHGNYAAPVITGGSAEWTAEPSLIAANSPKTLVGQYGDSIRVREIKHIIIPTFGLVAARGGLEASGTMIGKKEGVLGGFTSTPTQNNIMTADEIAVDVWLTDLLADLGSAPAKFLGAYKIDVAMNDLYVPDYPLNSAEPSFSGVAEGIPGVTVKITTRTDTEGMALYTAMQVGATKYMRLYAKGALISGVVYNDLTFDMPLVITKVPSYEEIDAVYGITYEAGVKVDSAFNSKLYKAVIHNTLLAL